MINNNNVGHSATKVAVKEKHIQSVVDVRPILPQLNESECAWRIDVNRIESI